MSCTCGGGNDLELGPDQGDLVLRGRVAGHAWSASLILTEGDAETPIAWPAAPVLEFNDFTVTAALAPDPDTSTANAMATWSMSAEQSDSLDSFAPVLLTVNDEAWFIGTVA